MCVMMAIPNRVITRLECLLRTPWLFLTKLSITNPASQRVRLLTVDIRMVVLFAVAHSVWESPTAHRAV